MAPRRTRQTKAWYAAEHGACGRTIAQGLTTGPKGKWPRMKGPPPTTSKDRQICGVCDRCTRPNGQQMQFRVTAHDWRLIEGVWHPLVDSGKVPNGTKPNRLLRLFETKKECNEFVSQRLEFWDQCQAQTQEEVITAKRASRLKRLRQIVVIGQQNGGKRFGTLAVIKHRGGPTVQKAGLAPPKEMMRGGARERVADILAKLDVRMGIYQEEDELLGVVIGWPRIGTGEDPWAEGLR